MKAVDEVRLVKGVVSPSFVNSRTGEAIPFEDRHNTLSYMSAEAVAAAFGGDSSLIPSKIGFVYGLENYDISDTISKEQSWALLEEELRGKNVDVQVVDFSFPPTLGHEPAQSDSSDSSGSDDPDEHVYAKNAVTFHAVSNSSNKGELFKKDAFSSSNYILQCVLLGGKKGDEDGYRILARASLKKDGGYLQKPGNFEVALDWTVVFRA